MTGDKYAFMRHELEQVRWRLDLAESVLKSNKESYESALAVRDGIKAELDSILEFIQLGERIAKAVDKAVESDTNIDIASSVARAVIAQRRRQKRARRSK